LSSASAGTFLFQNADVSNGVNYFLQLKHRNSIETLSKFAQMFTANEMTYNFSSGIAQAFGNNMIQADASPLRFAVYNGDENQDGTIDGSDLSDTENEANITLSGYVNTDATGDYFVDASDISLVEYNSGLGIGVVTP